MTPPVRHSIVPAAIARCSSICVATPTEPTRAPSVNDLRPTDAARDARLGFYYSHAFDWGEENGPGNDWDYPNPGGDRLLHGADWWKRFPEFLPKARKYVDEKSSPQLF